MKNTIIIPAILFTCSIATSGQGIPKADQVILMLKNDSVSPGKSLCEQKLTGNKKIDSLNQLFNFMTIKKQLLGRKSNKQIYKIQFPEGTDLDHVIEEYYKTKEIEYAEPDHIGIVGGASGVTPDDQYYSRQWALNNTGTFPNSLPGADIEMENAWSIEQGDSNIVVGFIDTGVKLDHPELDGRIWMNYDEIPLNAIDDDANGFVDDVIGWDFAYSDNTPADGYGHGTNVTGITASTGNNSIGYAGVDWNCKLMILKAFDDNGGGSVSLWVDAIYYAVDNGANVINMSFGTPSYSITLLDAITYALNHLVVPVACMMNTNDSTVYYPAGFPGVIAVGSTDPDDTRSNPFPWDSTSGSNFGNHISVVAPGNYIFGLDYQSNTNYNIFWSGTSQATPHVLGLAALLLAQDSDRTPAQIKSIIETTAEDMVGDPIEDIPGWDKYYGHGRINAYNALLITPVIDLNPADQFISVFPNPSKGDFTVKFPFGTMEIQIFNSLGQLICTKDPGKETTLNFQVMEDGIYFIQVIAENKIITKKVIVHK